MNTPENSDAARAATPTASEPVPREEGESVFRVNPAGHPVCSHVGRPCNPMDPSCCQPLDDLPLPEGAAHAADWEPEPGAPTGWSRAVMSHDQIGSVAVWARQFLDGMIATGDDGPKVMIEDRSYPPDAARMLADALIDAADLADRWAAGD